MKVLMVCLGNICRSPMAEGILRSKINGLDIEVDSAGTSAYHVGENPDSRAVLAARKHHVNIAPLVGRQFQAEDFDAFDVIYAMDNSNQNNILALARTPQDRAKVKLIVNEVFPNSDGEVPDPYFGGSSGFEEVYNLLDKATDKIIENFVHGR